MKKIITAVALFLFAGVALAQTPPQQMFVMSTTAASLGGKPVAIATGGVQLAHFTSSDALSVVYEFISNPADSSQPHIGSGLVNSTWPVSSFVPASVRSHLNIDLTNYNLTFQGGAGVESLWNGVDLPRTDKVVGNFGIYPSYPLPGGHVTISVGYKWIVGGARGVSGLVKAVPDQNGVLGNLVFHF